MAVALNDGLGDALMMSVNRPDRRKSQVAVHDEIASSPSVAYGGGGAPAFEDEEVSSILFDSPSGATPRASATDGGGNTKPAKRHAYSLMFVVAKSVTQLFAPVLQHSVLQPSVQRRRSSVSSSMISSTSQRPVLDPYLYTVNLARCHPAFQDVFDVVTPKAQGGGGGIRLPKAVTGGGAGKLEWSTRGGGSGGMDGSFLSGSSEGERTPSIVSPRSGAAPATFIASGNYFEPTNAEDPFEKDVFSQETRRLYHACKAADEKLDSLLSPFRQSLLRQQSELPNTPDRKLFGSNVKFVLAAKMWEVMFAVVRYAQRANAQYTEELFTQRVVRQMAPLCAIKLRQRLKRTRIAVAMNSITRPSIEVFKADRTFSHFPEEQLEGLRSRMTLVCFFKHEALLYRGVQDDQCFLIERGTAETRDGLTALQVFRRNYVVGALGMMVGEPRIHSVVASSEVLAWVIRKKDFEETLNHADAKTKNALIIVNEQRQRNIRDVYHEQLLPSSLRQFLLFTGIRDTVLETAVAESQPRVFRRGDVIFRAGDPATHALCVIRGRIRLSAVAAKPLSTSKTLQQHVAEYVCMQQSKRKANSVGANTLQAGNHLFIMRDERPASTVSMPSPSRNGHSRGGQRFGESTNNAANLDAPEDGSRRGHSPNSIYDRASPSPSPVSDGTVIVSDYHAPGMACDIACNVLVSLPQAVEHSNTVADAAMQRRLKAMHLNRENGEASMVGLGGDDDDAEVVSVHTHMFTVTVLSETIDCLLLSGDKLRAVLRADRETTNAFSYNLTCLALPFIKPLPRPQLLKTLFPPAFAFGFLPKLPLHTLSQTPIVFAPNDVITTDDVEQGDGACMVIVYKGELQRSDAAKLCAPTPPYMWPEISFGCTAGAKAITKALTSIEGVLIRRSELMHLVQTSLRGNDRTVLLESLKAHFSSRVGRKIPGVTAAMHGDVGPTTAGEAHAGNRRIRAALFGATEEELKREASMNLGGPSRGHARINPLIRAELNAIHLPKYPDRSCTIAAAVDKKHRNMSQRDAAGISQCSVIASDMAGDAADALTIGMYSPKAPDKKVSLSNWVHQAKSAVIEHTSHESGCIERNSPQLLLLPPLPALSAEQREDRGSVGVSPLQTSVVAAQSELFAANYSLNITATVSPVNAVITAPVAPLQPVQSPRANTMIAATLVQPLQHAFFIETGMGRTAPVASARAYHPAPPSTLMSAASSARVHSTSTTAAIPTSLLPPSVLQRRQAEIMRSLNSRSSSIGSNKPTTRAGADRTPYTAGGAAPPPVFQPTCASTRRARDEHIRRDRL